MNQGGKEHVESEIFSKFAQGEGMKAFQGDDTQVG